MGMDAGLLLVVSEVPDLDELSYDLSEAFGHERFWQREWNADGRSDPFAGRKCVRLAEDYVVACLRDSQIEDIPDGTVLDCAIATRHYAPGYERGDLPFILAVIRWLEVRLPGVPIYYDADRQFVELADASWQDTIWRHFCEVGHKPYMGGRGKDSGPTCDHCNRPTRRYLWGGFDQTGAWYCPGCGWRVHSTDGGQTYRDGDLPRKVTA